MNRSIWGDSMAAESRPFIHASRRYRLFFDETGVGDLSAARTNPNERYLSLTGLVIRQDIHDGYTTRRLDRLKLDIFQPRFADSIILHRRDLIRKLGIFAALNNDYLRAEFDARIAALVAEIPAPVFTVSIDKKRHLEKYKVWQFSPYHYTLTCLAERFVQWLERTNNQGDMTGEARNPTHDAQLRRAFRHFYKNGTEWVKAGTIQQHLTSRELRLEPKTANVAGSQLADILAHPAHRSFKFEKLAEPAPNDYGAFLAKIMVARLYDRHPRTKRIEGWGRKWLP